MSSDIKHKLLVASFVALVSTSLAVTAQETNFGPADPVPKDVSLFDPKRPVDVELQCPAST
jgi:hypothetical protein